jgi:hypothetical protein
LVSDDVIGRESPWDAELTDTELAVLTAAQRGDPIVFHHSSAAARERVELTAAFLSRLLARADEWHLHAHGIEVVGAQITGVLDLQSVQLARPFALRDCTFDKPISLRYATGETIRLPGCHVPSLDSTQLHLHGDFQLNDGFRSAGEVIMADVQIDGALVLSGGSFQNIHAIAIKGDGLAVGGDVYVEMNGTARFEAHGEVRLPGARIGGELRCGGALLNNPGGVALVADGIAVDGGVSFTGDDLARFEAHGEVRLPGARIGGEPLRRPAPR